MLTLKVITTDINGQTETHLFSGEYITHKEYLSSDHCIVSKVQKNNPITYVREPTVWIIGNITESSNSQVFIASDIAIYDDDRCLKNLLFIAPKADCYIMDNGKTIDSFFCQYEQLKTAGEIGDNLVDKQ